MTAALSPKNVARISLSLEACRPPAAPVLFSFGVRAFASFALSLSKTKLLASPRRTCFQEIVPSLPCRQTLAIVCARNQLLLITATLTRYAHCFTVASFFAPTNFIVWQKSTGSDRMATKTKRDLSCSYGVTFVRQHHVVCTLYVPAFLGLLCSQLPPE